MGGISRNGLVVVLLIILSICLAQGFAVEKTPPSGPNPREPPTGQKTQKLRFRMLPKGHVPRDAPSPTSNKTPPPPAF
ncbi:hypothetical protein M5689_022356 [Euphorbia peplus]|nr:hypothetical protein M5689_022356 [Euphorbia peplus]